MNIEQVMVIMGQSFDIISDIFNQASNIHKNKAISSWKGFSEESKSRGIPRNTPKPNAPISVVPPKSQDTP